MEAALRHNARVVDLQLDGKAETAVIQEVQYDHLGKDVLHVDFKRVDQGRAGQRDGAGSS